MAIARRRLLASAWPFKFPGGNARFDPSHIASGACTMSAVPLGATFVDLLTGKAGTVAGAPTAGVHSIMGPFVKFAGGSDNVVITGKRGYAANTGPLGCTIAAILMINSIATQQVFLALGINGTDTGFSMFGTSGATSVFGITHAGAATINSTWAGAVSVPIFVMASQNLTAGTGGTQSANIVAMRLDTGQMYANSATAGTMNAGVIGGTYNIGSRGAASLPANASIAAIMTNDRSMSLPQLVQWAANPWSFWYPSR